MNRVFLQIWGEYDPIYHFINDGCSIHLNESHMYSFKGDKKSVKLGEPIEVFISDDLYDKLLVRKSLKINEISFRNLLNFDDIVYNENEL